MMRAVAALAVVALLALVAGSVSAASRQQTVVNICNRTQEIQDHIISHIVIGGGNATCSTVTGAQLAAITGTFQVIGYSGSTLLRSDFAGLTGNITTIDIQDSPELQTVPADAFDEFTKSGVT